MLFKTIKKPQVMLNGIYLTLLVVGKLFVFDLVNHPVEESGWVH
jgi:hypothetical protein